MRRGDSTSSTTERRRELGVPAMGVDVAGEAVRSDANNDCGFEMSHQRLKSLKRRTSFVFKSNTSLILRTSSLVHLSRRTNSSELMPPPCEAINNAWRAELTSGFESGTFSRLIMLSISACVTDQSPWISKKTKASTESSKRTLSASFKSSNGASVDGAYRERLVRIHKSCTSVSPSSLSSDLEVRSRCMHSMNSGHSSFFSVPNTERNTRNASPNSAELRSAFILPAGRWR
mmetsp:Transcript_28272/g.45452  ORF Transcript_28272/g.45452 Transcript_28272/m.45452 type:complete len:232 (-) Transcript_28272:211-906(-)